jgi:cyclase
MLGDPVQVAKIYNKSRSRRNCFFRYKCILWKKRYFNKCVKNVAKELFIPFTVGGGIRTIEDFKTILYARSR